MRSRRPVVELFKYPGLVCGFYECGVDNAMPTFVSHNDVGLTYMERGGMRVLNTTGYRYELRPGRLAVYWGAVPHKVEAYEPDSLLHWLTLPLGIFFRWPLPQNFTRQLIQGRVFFETNPHEAPFDLEMLKRWHDAIHSRDTEAVAIVVLELEARLRRLAHTARGGRVSRLTPRGAGSQAERMLLLVAEHFREPLTIQDVAAAVGLRADYVGRLFRKHMGMGLTDYITECRVSHAKALLATTDTNVVDVAQDSGFGSVSQFHAVFQKLCGCTPRVYRTRLLDKRKPA